MEALQPAHVVPSVRGGRLFCADGTVARTKARLDDFKTGHPTLGHDDTELWAARQVCDMALSGEHVKPWYARTPFVSAAVSAFGMVTWYAGSRRLPSKSSKAVALVFTGMFLKGMCRDVKLDFISNRFRHVGVVIGAMKFQHPGYGLVFGVLTLAGWAGLPLLCAVFPARGAVDASELEPEFHNMLDSHGDRVDRFTYDHSIWAQDKHAK
ncbi:hypothetical protein H310_09995 [Aphanomyces invadans]|uniref:Uncharacterized protein n=1 Tax=Aphanomyces invadans TaxID=157072 RepID=A0A024TV30_9STRA|nr:hypothetical protein H310_09995 [Aphanomyces invadans]ETV97207.1 hypothetical protein H310_09995 [Aphanomyces invadans]|eukprot:XP_008874453.1 hypothetical protein H310_09995 [Aphanomyces invadans]